MSSREWKETVLGDFIDIKHGYAFKGEFFSNTETEDILVTPGNFKVGGGFKQDKLKYYNGECPEEYILKPNDVIVTMTDLSKMGDTLGYSALVPRNKKKRYLHNQRIGLVEPLNNKVSLLFIYWRLRSNDYQKYIVASASGSTVKHTSPKIIKSFQLNLPPLQEQKTIADTLSCLDDMIELNNRTNQVLEEMVQGIFKRWFVDFEFPNEDGEPYKSSRGEMVDSELGEIPKGWEIKLLGDCIESIDNRGKTPPLSTDKTDYPIIDVKALSGDSRIIDYGNCTKYVNRDIYENWFRSGHPRYFDILLSTVGSLAQMKIFFGDVGCIAQNVVGLRSISVSPLFLYEYLKSIRNDLISYDIGSVQPSIKVTHIIKHKILLPNNDLLTAYDKMSSSISKLIYQNSTLNQKLASIRDTLLPKLMSGEIRVPIEEVV